MQVVGVRDGRELCGELEKVTMYRSSSRVAPRVPGQKRHGQRSEVELNLGVVMKVISYT